MVPARWRPDAFLVFGRSAERHESTPTIGRLIGQGEPAASLRKEKAERMTCRVEVNADVILGLIAGQDCPARDGMLACGCQILDGDIKMHLHLLIARTGRPYRRLVPRLGLEGQASATIGGPQFHPARLVLLHCPAQQPAVEIRQGARIG
jgi:hypothetical protein